MLGDDVFGRIDEFLAKGYEMADMDTGEPISTIRDRIQSANAYIGAFPLGRSAGHRRQRRDRRPFDRYRAGARRP